jgi:hypothetical protein
LVPHPEDAEDEVGDVGAEVVGYVVLEDLEAGGVLVLSRMRLRPLNSALKPNKI